LKDIVTRVHLDYIGRIMLAFGMIVDYAYTQEIFMAWYSGEPFYHYVYVDRIWAGPYAPVWWAMIFCNVFLLQLLWFKRVRRSPLAMLGVTIVANIGMWLERFQIVFTSTHADYTPSAWGTIWPTSWDRLVYAGSLGLFGFLMLLFVRVMPLISLHDMRELLAQRGQGQR